MVRTPLWTTVLLLPMTTCSCHHTTPRIPPSEKLPLESKHVLPIDSVSQGALRLALRENKVAIGKEFSVHLCFTNTGGGGYAFNPFIAPGIPCPVRIDVYDARHQYLGSYLSAALNTLIPPHTQDWVHMWTDSQVGQIVKLLGGRIPNTVWAHTAYAPLPPGRYYLQAVLPKGFVNFRSTVDQATIPIDQLGKALIDLYATFDRSEWLRSNVVELQLVNEDERGGRNIGSR